MAKRPRRNSNCKKLAISNGTHISGEKWEIACAKDEKKLLGIWAYKDDRTNLEGVHTVVWTWDAIRKFIDSL